MIANLPEAASLVAIARKPGEKHTENRKHAGMLPVLFVLPFFSQNLKLDTLFLGFVPVEQTGTHLHVLSPSKRPCLYIVHTVH